MSAKSLEDSCEELLSIFKGDKVLKGFTKKVLTTRNIEHVSCFRIAIKELINTLREAFFVKFYQMMPNNLPEEIARKIFGFTQLGTGMFTPRYLSDDQHSEEMALNENLRQRLLQAYDSIRAIIRNRLSRSESMEDMIERFHHVTERAKKCFTSFQNFCAKVFLWPDPVKLRVEREVELLWSCLSERVSFSFSSQMWINIELSVYIPLSASNPPTHYSLINSKLILQKMGF